MSKRVPRVAINARAAVRTEIGGVERLAREMAKRLPALRPDRYRVIRPPRALAHRAGHAWEQVALPLLAGAGNVIYSPANLAPVLWPGNVVVIHDAAALRHPEAYSAAYVAYQRRMLPLLARRARLVITVSEFSRHELVDLLGLAPEQIAVIPEGVDERFSPEADPAPAASEYRLDRPYALVVGTLSERKNLTVLETIAGTLREHGIEFVLAGSQRGYLRGAETSLRRLGYVPERLLPSVYAGARALVMPSFYEGFGLPCLEAMASGVPVVAAGAGALPELVDRVGRVVAPDDVAGFADAVLEACADGTIRRGMIAAGLERARRASWDETAMATDRAIERVLARA